MGLKPLAKLFCAFFGAEAPCTASFTLAESVNYPCFSKVVRRHLQLDPISRRQPDESLPHFSRDVGEDEMLICKLNAEHGSREHSDDLSFGYNRTFHGHSKISSFRILVERDSHHRIAAFEAAIRLVIPWTRTDTKTGH